jgi:hypothetical protein
VTDLDVHINTRCPRAFRDRVDEAAKLMGMNRSEWVIKACEDSLRHQFVDRVHATGTPKPRTRLLVAGRRNPALCSHPVEVRSAVGPDGTARCMACNAEVRAL